MEYTEYSEPLSHLGGRDAVYLGTQQKLERAKNILCRHRYPPEDWAPPHSLPSQIPT